MTYCVILPSFVINNYSYIFNYNKSSAWFELIDFVIAGLYKYIIR